MSGCCDVMMYLRDNSDTERDSGPGWRISPSDAERWFPVVIVDDAHSEERVEPGPDSDSWPLPVPVTVIPAQLTPTGDTR